MNSPLTFRTRATFWLTLLCLQLALVLGSVSFTSVQMPVMYGDLRLSGHYGADLQRQAWEAFSSRHVPVAPDTEPMLHALSSRVFVPAVLAASVRLFGLSWERAFSLFRLASAFACLAVFFWFLSLQFAARWAIVGLLFVAATLPLIFNNPYEIPTEFPELLLFTLGVACILYRRDLLLCIVIAVATLNRETSCLLALMLLFARWSWPIPMRLVGIIATAGFSWLIPIVMLRWWIRDFQWPHGHSLAHNIPGLLRFLENLNPFNNYLFYIYLLGILWAIPYFYWRSQPPNLRRLLLAVPAMLCVYLFGGGFLNEPREIVVFYPILVPAGLYALNTMLESPPPTTAEAPTS